MDYMGRGQNTTADAILYGRNRQTSSPALLTLIEEEIAEKRTTEEYEGVENIVSDVFQEALRESKISANKKKALRKCLQKQLSAVEEEQTGILAFRNAQNGSTCERALELLAWGWQIENDPEKYLPLTKNLINAELDFKGCLKTRCQEALDILDQECFLPFKHIKRAVYPTGGDIFANAKTVHYLCPSGVAAQKTACGKAVQLPGRVKTSNGPMWAESNYPHTVENITKLCDRCHRSAKSIEMRRLNKDEQWKIVKKEIESRAAREVLLDLSNQAVAQESTITPADVQRTIDRVSWGIMAQALSDNLDHSASQPVKLYTGLGACQPFTITEQLKSNWSKTAKNS